MASVVFANTVNLGADLGAMADVLSLLIGGPRLAYLALASAACVGLLLRPWLYVQCVKGAALSLFVYVLAVLSVAPSWSGLLNHLPTLTLSPLDAPSVAILVAVVGTSISP